MTKEANGELIRRLVSAVAVLGALALISGESVQAQGREGFFRRIQSRFRNRHNDDSARTYDIQQVQNEQPAFERADDKEVPFEEPGTTAPPAVPSYESAADKQTAPEEPPEPWTLTNLFDDDCGGNCFKDNGWKISGHSQWGYQTDPDGAFTGNGPFLNQQEWGQFNANQQYLFIEKIADGKDGFGWGARFDTFYGVDGNEGQSFGNINPGHWDYLNGFDHGAYEWALPQAYGEIAYKDLSVKLGHFYTIVGYEVIPSTGQFFLSRQLTFWNSEPFTHTGALATYKASDNLSVSGGWVLGMDTGYYQYEQGNAFLGGFTYKIDDKTTFVYSMIGGNLGWRGDGAINSFILSRQWTEKLSTVHQFDVLGTNLRQADGTPADFRDPNSFTPRDSTGLINYAFYDITSTVKAGIRYEWYKADSVSYNTLTFGINYKPWSWLLIRPEVRGMWSPGNKDIYTGAHGYSDKLFNQTVFGVDAIFIF